MTDIAVYVGSSPETKLCYEVLKHSIKCNGGYRVIDLSVLDIELNDASRSSTPFSKARLSIPLLSEGGRYRVYLDSDMVCLGDLSEMVQQCSKGRRGIYSINWATSYEQFSVLLFDMEKLDVEAYRKKLKILDGTPKAMAMLGEVLGIERLISDEWNCLDFIHKRTKLVHFTFMPTQPWVYKNSGYVSWYSDQIAQFALNNVSRGKEVILSAIENGDIGSHIINEEVKRRVIGSNYRRPMIFIPYWLVFKFKGRPRSAISFLRKAVMKLRIMSDA